MDCLPFFFRSRPVGMNFGARTVKRNEIDLNCQYPLSPRRFKYPFYDPSLCPTVDPSVYSVPFAESVRHCPPFAAVFRDIKQRVQERQVVYLDITPLYRKNMFYLIVLA
jgi:hypothetical protein